LAHGPNPFGVVALRSQRRLSCCAGIHCLRLSLHVPVRRAGFRRGKNTEKQSTDNRQYKNAQELFVALILMEQCWRLARGL
jgi:hypothetical protein